MKATVKRHTNYDDAFKITFDGICIRVVLRDGEAYFCVRDVLSFTGGVDPKRWAYNQKHNKGKVYETVKLRYPCCSDNPTKRNSLKFANRKVMKAILQDTYAARTKKDFIINELMNIKLSEDMECGTFYCLEEKKRNGDLKDFTDYSKDETAEEAVFEINENAAEPAVEEKPEEKEPAETPAPFDKDEINRKLDMLIISIVEMKKMIMSA